MSESSFKNDLVLSYASIKYSEKDYLILVTSAGTVCGKPLLNDDINKLPPYAKFISEAIGKYRKDKNIPSDAILAGADSFIILIDVMLKSSGSTIELPYLVVFIDQIIGISDGAYSK